MGVGEGESERGRGFELHIHTHISFIVSHFDRKHDELEQLAERRREEVQRHLVELKKMKKGTNTPYTLPTATHAIQIAHCHTHSRAPVLGAYSVKDAQEVKMREQRSMESRTN